MIKILVLSVCCAIVCKCFPQVPIIVGVITKGPDGSVVIQGPDGSVITSKATGGSISPGCIPVLPGGIPVPAEDPPVEAVTTPGEATTPEPKNANDDSDSTPSSEPTPQAAAEPSPEPSPELAPGPSSEPAPDATLEPALELASGPASDPTIAPVSDVEIIGEPLTTPATPPVAGEDVYLEGSSGRISVIGSKVLVEGPASTFTKDFVQGKNVREPAKETAAVEYVPHSLAAAQAQQRFVQLVPAFRGGPPEWTNLLAPGFPIVFGPPTY